MSAAGVGVYGMREAWAAAPIGRPASHQTGEDGCPTGRRAACSWIRSR